MGKRGIGAEMSPEDSARCIAAERAIHGLMASVQESTGSSAVGVSALWRTIGWVLVSIYPSDEEAIAHVERILPMVLRDIRAEKDGEDAAKQH